MPRRDKPEKQVELTKMSLSPRFLYIWGVVVLGLFVCAPSLANNLVVSNVELKDQKNSETIQIEFDISWDNSWYNSRNHDAVWVFAKYSTDSGVTWAHATLNTAGTNPADTVSGDGTSITIVVPNDLMGAFIKRTSIGSGTVDTDNLQIVWDYAADGVANAASARVRVFGIEMTYIPEGAFYAGDKGTGSALLKQGSADTDPWYIQNSQAISVTATTSDGYYYTKTTSGSDDATGSVFTIPGVYPTGYDAFYLMKYEVPQSMYRDFLNTLTQAEQNTRVASTLTNEDDANTYVMVSEGRTTPHTRQAIKAGANPADGSPYTFTVDLDDDDTGDETNDGEWVAMNFVTWPDVAALADWAGLRPLTGLEFEKAARGKDIAAVADEYVWGTTALVQAEGAIQNSGQTSEVANTVGTGLANYNGAGTDSDGPIRVGFAGTAGTNREQAGAGYYGNLNLGDNVSERIVHLGNTAGRQFAGTHGDGLLTTATGFEGSATNTDWPGIDNTAARGVTGVAGSGFRASNFGETRTLTLTISDRVDSATENTSRFNTAGSRYARTAP